MSTLIPGDGRTFAHHVLTLNLDEVFHHDIPKVTGFADREAKILRDGWSKLDITLQNDMLHASGVMDTIAADLNAAPTAVVDSILSKFSDLTKEKLQTGLAKLQGILTGVEAIANQDAETTIANLQTYIKSKVASGSRLGSILSIAMQALTVIFNPTSIIAQVATYAETAYQIIKSIFGKK